MVKLGRFGRFCIDLWGWVGRVYGACGFWIGLG